MNHDSVRVVIIADDLTGAMDAAVPFARRGLRVIVVPEVDKIPADHVDADVLSISTNSRHCSEEEAVDLVRQAYSKLSFCYPEVLIKKIDSTLRGHVVAESCALLAASVQADCIVCPAVPAQKRTMIDGTLLIDGIPLVDTAMAKDIRSRPPTGPLDKLFTNHATGTMVRLEKAGNYRDPLSSPDNSRVVICDAVNDADIENLVQSRESILKRTLFVGASGLTEALAEMLYGKTQSNSVVIPGSTNALFVIGSVARETKAQVDELVQSGIQYENIVLESGSPITSALADALFRRKNEFRAILIKAPEYTDGEEYSSDEIVGALAESARVISSACDIDLIVGTGGDTVQGLLSHFDIEKIVVLGEIEHGVVFGSIEADGKALLLVTKAGGFGERDLFLKILQFFTI